MKIDLNAYATEKLQEKKLDKFSFDTATPYTQDSKRNDKSELLNEISKLFDDLGESTNSAKRYWLQVWLKNKGYPQVQSGKDMSRKQLQELKAYIVEVLNC